MADQTEKDGLMGVDDIWMMSIRKAQNVAAAGNAAGAIATLGTIGTLLGAATPQPGATNLPIPIPFDIFTTLVFFVVGAFSTVGAMWADIWVAARAAERAAQALENGGLNNLHPKAIVRLQLVMLAVATSSFITGVVSGLVQLWQLTA